MPHTYSSLIIHAIFGTKERRPLTTTAIKEELFAYMGGIIGLRRHGVKFDKDNV